MSSVQATVSFEERRVVMRKVEKMVIEAEALNKTRHLRREEVHVSDASSSESEGEFANIPNLSPILHIGSDKSSSQESLRCRGGDVTPRFGNRRKIKSRLAFTDEIELEALSPHRNGPPPPQDKPQNRSVSSTGKLDRSIASTAKSVPSTPSSANDSIISLNSYRGGPVSSVCSTAKIDRSNTPAGKKSVASTPSSTKKNAASLVSYRGGSVNSLSSTYKLDSSITPTGKYTTSTPSSTNNTHKSPNGYRGETDNSTAPKAKPDRRTTSTGKSTASRTSSTSNSTATPLTLYRGVPVNSPPFSASPGVATPESTSLAVATPSSSSSSRKNARAMKKEIGDLTARFESMEKERTVRRSTGSSDKEINFEDAERAFEEGVDIMGRKTDAVIDALHKSLSHSCSLQRDNDGLRGRVRNLAKGGRASRSPVIPSDEICIENQVSLLGPEKTVDHFNPSNEYLKRRYPAIPTTPGTLFVSEIVEVLNLDVGDHTYLSDIMNRQWESSADYVPS